MSLLVVIVAAIMSTGCAHSGFLEKVKQTAGSVGEKVKRTAGSIANSVADSVTSAVAKSVAKLIAENKSATNAPPDGVQLKIEMLKIQPLAANIPLERLKRNKPLDPTKLFEQDIAGKDRVLFLMERGRLAQMTGDFAASKASFNAAIQAIKENDEKAVISAKEVGSQFAALLVNDKAIPYKGNGFERVMLRHFQALNYLAAGDLEGAGVEVRGANFEQEKALKDHEKEVTDVRTAMEELAGALEKNSNITSAFSVMGEAAGKVKNSFQNAYTFYMSGIMREMLKEPNDAYIDYKKALEIYPNNTFVQKDVVRLARALEMTDDLERFKTQYPSIAANSSHLSATNGELVVFFEDGLVPQKEGIGIPIPLPHGLTAVAFPIYNFKLNDPKPLTLSLGSNAVGQSEPICFTGALAVKALKEKIPAMAVRQVIRSALKGAAAKEAKDKFGESGATAASVYNVLSEQADTRCWISLPENAQILRASLPAGQHELSLAQNETGASTSAPVAIQAGQKTILRVIRVEKNLVAQQLWPAVQAAKTEQPGFGVQGSGKEFETRKVKSTAEP